MSKKIKIERGEKNYPLAKIITEQCEDLVTEYMIKYVKPNYRQIFHNRKIRRIIDNCTLFYAVTQLNEEGNKNIHALISICCIGGCSTDTTISAMIGNPIYFHILLRRAKHVAKDHDSYNLFAYIPDNDELREIFTSEDFVEIERYYNPDTHKVTKIKMFHKVERYVLNPYALQPDYF